MMLGLFALQAIALILIAKGNRKIAYILTFVTLLLGGLMMFHHANSVIGIRL
jgi:hypothetical protein